VRGGGVSAFGLHSSEQVLHELQDEVFTSPRHTHLHGRDVAYTSPHIHKQLLHLESDPGTLPYATPC
jgi:hypothetical protein